MSKQELVKFLSFLHQAEKLKAVLRHSWLSGGRRESVAEHSWRLGLMALVLGPKMKPRLKMDKVIKMTIVHDIAEIYSGDPWAFKTYKGDKASLEAAALEKLVKPLWPEAQAEMRALCAEYTAAHTPEAKFIKALDKIETLLQHNEAKITSWNQKEFSFNFEYGDDKCLYDDTLWELKELVKEECFDKIMKEYTR